MSSERVNTAIATAAGTLAVAKLQKEVADRYADMAKELHDFQLSQAKADAASYGAARGCVDATLAKDCARPDETPNYEEVQARAEADVRLATGAAKKQASERMNAFCIGAICGTMNQIALTETLLITDARAFARRREETRIDLSNERIRMNKINSIAAARGNYSGSMAGIAALAQLYDKTSSNAMNGVTNTLTAGAMALGRIFNMPDNGQTGGRTTVQQINPNAILPDYVNEMDRQSDAATTYRNQNSPQQNFRANEIASDYSQIGPIHEGLY
jgi:hypothetical protein